MFSISHPQRRIVTHCQTPHPEKRCHSPDDKINKRIMRIRAVLALIDLKMNL
jgi:hypothetical protein